MTASRSAPEFTDYLLDAACYPRPTASTSVMDNLGSHTRKAMVEHFGEKAALFGVGLYGTSGGPMFPIWVVQRAERLRGANAS